MNIFMLIDPNYIVREIHRPAVQKGAVWLDEYEPKWSEKIVPKDLNLASTDLCICGQLFGCYSQRPDFVYAGEDFGFNNRSEEVTEMFDGCYWYDPDDEDDDSHHPVAMSYKALDMLWLDEIFWRRCEELEV